MYRIVSWLPSSLLVMTKLQGVIELGQEIVPVHNPCKNRKCIFLTSIYAQNVEFGIVPVDKLQHQTIL